MALLPNRYPFLLLDSVLEVEKGVRIVALKNVTATEPFLQGHFPQAPIMPGVLLIEAMAQAGIVLYTLTIGETSAERHQPKYLGKVEVRFFKPAVPGDQLLIELRVVRILKGAIALTGVVSAHGETVAKGDLLLMQATRAAASEPEHV